MEPTRRVQLNTMIPREIKAALTMLAQKEKGKPTLSRYVETILSEWVEKKGESNERA